MAKLTIIFTNLSHINLSLTDYHLHCSAFSSSFLIAIPVCPEKGAKVLEIGCGAGLACMALGKLFPNTSIVGIEISEEEIKDATRNLEKTPLKNVAFQVADINKLPSDWTEEFDYVLAIKVIHHAVPSKALREVHRVLKADGVFTLVEKEWYRSMLDNMILSHAVDSYAENLFIRVTKEDSEGVQAIDRENCNIRGCFWYKDHMKKSIKEAGFEYDVEYKIPNSLSETIFTCRKQH